MVQIVYQPEKGAPVALCLMKEMNTDKPLADRQKTECAW